MNTFVNELEDLVDYLASIERAKRPKKAKSLKNYIATFYGGDISNLHHVIKEMEQQGWIFVGMNGEIIYNF
ncbi:hypothetical protein [Flectobacillus major]|jgi:predicted transcriptional regulator|uniref:hypothetical protein n=1 Tax=Flectobacillus major TaxID=103 RepID=UPI000425B012|nr:hypothetical protein [Flectobacillus major]